MFGNATYYYHDRRQRGITGLDERDSAILAKSEAAFNARVGPRVGDVIVFADGVRRYISYEWTDHKEYHGGYQSSKGGSFHIGESGYLSFSGSLYSTVPRESLTLTDETTTLNVWFFHHNWACASNGVHADITVRVYTCSLPAPK